LLRVLHLTDPHLFADPRGDFRDTVTYESLSSVLAHYRNSDWLADLVIVTGDLIQDGSTGAYEQFRQLLGDLELPVHCLPGNHDVRSKMRETLSAPPFFYCDSVEHSNWLIAGIDSCVTGQAGGLVSAQELARLDGLIADSAASHIMICLHHPPVAVGSKWLDSVGLENSDEFLDRISATGVVRLVVFGHVHQPYDEVHGDIRIIGTPSTCRQFAQRSDEFAVDDKPPAYRRIGLHADGHYDCELIWVDHD